MHSHETPKDWKQANVSPYLKKENNQKSKLIFDPQNCAILIVLYTHKKTGKILASDYIFQESIVLKIKTNVFTLFICKTWQSFLL